MFWFTFFSLHRFLPANPTLRSTNIAIAGKGTRIEHGDIPASYDSLPEGKSPKDPVGSQTPDPFMA